MKIGSFDHLSLRLGGSQHVVARMAALLSQQSGVDVIHTGKGYALSSLATALDVNLIPAKDRLAEGSLDIFPILAGSHFRLIFGMGYPTSVH